MSMHQVVVEAKEGRHEGEIVSGNAAEVARSKGVVLLPIEPDLLKRSAFSGWSKRAYGKGWMYVGAQVSRGCPLMLHVSPQFPIIEWSACLVMDPSLGALGGSLRLAMDTAQLGAQPTGIVPETAPIHVGDLKFSEEGLCIVGGKARSSIPADMFLAVQLYGMLGGCKVRWFAMSQTR